MNTDHRTEVDSLKNIMMEEKEIELTAFETKSY